MSREDQYFYLGSAESDLTYRIRNTVLPVVWRHVEGKKDDDRQCVHETRLDKDNNNISEWRLVHDSIPMLEVGPDSPNAIHN